MIKKPSLDELLSKRQAGVVRGERGDMLTKAFRAPTSWDPNTKSARFVMSSQAPDRYLDVIVTEGIETLAFMQNPVGLIFHASRNWPVGQWSDVEKMLTNRPPRLEGTLTLDTADEVAEVDEALQQARIAARKIANGTLRACSIGFMPIDWELIRDENDEWTGGFRFVESELVECSLVSVPAHPRALVKDAGGDPAILRRLLEQHLDEWRAELEEFGVGRADYEAALRSIVERDQIAPMPAESVRTITESILGGFRKMFGGRSEPATEAPPPASPEAAAAAREKAAAVRARLAEKGLILTA